MFSVDKYKLSKEAVINMIKSSHDWEKSEGFIADGLISPQDYSNQKLKIAVVLGESYGYDRCGVTDIELQPSEDILGVGHPNRQTSRRVPALLWFLFEHIRNGKKIESDDERIYSLLKIDKENVERLQNVLINIAWINVKKASRPGGDGDSTRQDPNEIYAAAIRNREILIEQINSISPDLLIVCSDPVGYGLLNQNILGAGIVSKQKQKIMQNENGMSIFFVSHPIYHEDWGYKGLFIMYNKIVDGLGL